jgi:threonyl-tRNA synthetase
VIIHRALLGSIERFFGTLIEHYAGAFPFWLAPVQAVVLPLSDKFNDYAEKQFKLLKDKGYRVELDNSKEKLNYRIRNAQLMKIPFMLIAGGREEEAGTLSVRNRFEGDLGSSSFTEICAMFDELVASRAVKP